MFEQVYFEQGLSSNWVRDIEQDSAGFIWMATNDGLNRYDGTKIKIFRRDESNPRAILNNYIRCTHVDKAGKLWVGYSGGLSEYIKETEDFINHVHNPNNPQSLPARKVADITSDSKNTLWVITSTDLCYYEPAQYAFRKIPFPGFEKAELAKIMCDSKDRLWIASLSKGLFCYDIKSGKFTAYNNGLSTYLTIGIYEDFKGRIWVGGSEIPLALVEGDRLRPIPALKAGELVQEIGEDAHHTLWVAIENGGIVLLDPETLEAKQRLLHSEFIPYSIGHNSINTIFKDREQNMWFGTFASGASLLKYPNNIFGYHFQKPGVRNSLSFNSILSISETKSGLWIGTDNGGLNFYDYSQKQYRVYTKENSSLETNVVISMAIQDDDQVWVGNYLGGLQLIDKSGKTKEAWLPKVSIGSLCIDKINQRLWIGTWNSGLYLLDLKTKKMKSYMSDPANPTSISDNFIFMVYMDSKNHVWCCTTNGLNLVLDAEKGEFRRFYKEEKNSLSIIGNNVYSCFEDSKHRFWIGTSEGICLMNRDSLKFTKFTHPAIQNANILSFQEDRSGNIWFSTFGGLYCYNNTKKTVYMYNVSDGLQGNQFTRSSALLSSGELVFGGSSGFNRFLPEEILAHNKPCPVRLVTCFVNDEERISNNLSEKGRLSSIHLNELESLNLTYQENNLKLVFGAINYFNPNRLTFSYKLDGFDDNWKTADATLSASYTNLNPGTYTFQVRSWLYNESEPGPIKSLTIVIQPPYYATWWFISLASLVFLVLVYKLYGYSVAALKRRQLMLEDRVRERTKQIEKQKEEIEELYLELEDSIDAAKTIQFNLLPSETEIVRHFPKYALRYLPKQKVSGDFYWLKEIDNKVYFSLIDCTGHGVPGAFLTMIASDKLDNLVSGEHCNVANILNQLNQQVVRTLRDPQNEFHMEGMDIALCEFDKNTHTLRFAGAKMSIVIFQGTEFVSTKGHRFSIGTHKVGTHLEFEISEIQLKPGDRIYLFTDGFTDQLGGENNQKFLLRRILENLELTSGLSIEAQGDLLFKAFQEWKGDTPQLDDVTFWFLEV
ncbi:MAG: SpoIIE family protein phosphatase [Cytophagaceae bacterium]|nr:SpoIIE family protein phosphatase [Cytophagaceae bacterium]